MKKYLISALVMTMVAVMSFGLTACGGDDDDNGGGSNDAALVGKWFEQSDSYVRGVKFTSTMCSYGKWSVGSSEKYQNADATYTANNGKLSIKTPGGKPFEMSYTINGRTLTLVPLDEYSQQFAGIYEKQ